MPSYFVVERVAGVLEGFFIEIEQGDTGVRADRLLEQKLLHFLRRPASHIKHPHVPARRAHSHRFH